MHDDWLGAPDHVQTEVPTPRRLKFLAGRPLIVMSTRLAIVK